MAAQQAMAEAPPPKDPFMVETAVTINAPSATVWQAVRFGEANRLAAQAVYRGHVPGTPHQQLGALSYAIVRDPDGRRHDRTSAHTGATIQGPDRISTRPDLSQPSHRLSRRHRTRASSLDIRWIVTCGARGVPGISDRLVIRVQVAPRRGR